MPQTRDNGIVVPINSDDYNPTQAMADLADSANVATVVANAAARDALDTFPGRLIYRLDTNRLESYTGSAWSHSGGGGPYAAAAGVSSFTMNGTATTTTTVNFPAGRFTAAPIISLGKQMSGRGEIVFFAINSTTSGFTLGAQSASGAARTDAVGCSWTAVQMTPTSGAG
jgi:hypothetical protein